MIHEMSTALVPARERLAWWGDAVWRLIGGLESDAFGDEQFDGRIVHGQAGAVGLACIEATRHRVVRTPALARRGEQAFLKIAVQLEGRACFEQKGRKVWLAPGQWSLYDTTDAYTVTNPVQVRQLVVMIPKEQLPMRGVQLDELMVQCFDGRRGASRLAWDAMLGAFDELPRLPAQAAAGVGDAIAQLVAASLLERAGQPTGMSPREALRERLKEHIARHLREPGLTVERIARALNCSRRHLYNAFDDEPDGVAGYILRQRLEACRRELLLHHSGRAAVTEAAFAWGFSNLAHFSRVFKARYGMAPSEYRRQAVST